MNNICNCNDWKTNMGFINGLFMLGQLHNIRYIGTKWMYCPWCGEKLVLEVENVPEVSEVPDIA